tara:strand:- start:5108 stop:5590 length:483 start_codon:yes stop_codon:yes gene_type:complete
VAVKKKEIPPNPMVHELLEAVDSERTKAKKVSLLKQHGDNAIKSMFIWNFDETVVSMLPSGDVPYQPVDSTQITNLGAGVANRSTIRNKADTFYNFVKGGNNGLNKVKRETMFIGLLESLHPSEADILILVKDKQLGTKYKVTRELVSEAYPDIQWGGRS